MGKIKANSTNTLLSLENVKRCFMTALLSAALFPLLMLLRLLEPENTVLEALLIPLTFFAAASAAFAYLLYQSAKHRMAAYYELVMWLYLCFFEVAMAYFAGVSVKNGGGIFLYYAAVVAGAYVAYLNIVQYMALAMLELTAYIWFVMAGADTMITALPLFTLAGVHLFAFVLSRDGYNIHMNYLTEEHKLKREMQESEHDPLTGLVNRRGLERRVDKVWKTCADRREMVAAYIIDIDFFKKYNDHFGHVQGDVCIKRIAKSLSDSVGKAGIVSRIGGEEFLVFVKGRNEQELHDLGEQMRSAVEKMAIPAPKDGVVTISVGMDLTYADKETTLQGLYGRADRQLYEAKKSGRNCVRSTRISRRPVKIG